jgi:hypothetical protein
LSRLLGVVCGLLFTAGQAAALDVPVAPYLQSLAARQVGVVQGRVYQHRSQPHAPDVPFAGASVVLVPRSGALERALEDLKRHSRQSALGYREAVGRMRSAKERYERELSQAGAGELVRPLLVDAEGAFRAVDVPAGDWLIIVSHADFMPASGARATAKERDQFRTSPRVTGFEAVRLWIRPITVAPGHSESVELTDRNIWFSGVAENRVMDTGR